MILNDDETGTICTDCTVTPSMDLTVGQERLTTYLQEDAEGKYRFRVWERFALRLKAPTAILRLDFVTPAS